VNFTAEGVESVSMVRDEHVLHALRVAIADLHDRVRQLRGEAAWRLHRELRDERDRLDAVTVVALERADQGGME
jgi:hypothetical protein